MNQSHLFPDLTMSYAAALEEKPILLDGQKVLFDKKVTLMPVALEKKKNSDGTELG